MQKISYDSLKKAGMGAFSINVCQCPFYYSFMGVDYLIIPNKETTVLYLIEDKKMFVDLINKGCDVVPLRYDKFDIVGKDYLEDYHGIKTISSYDQDFESKFKKARWEYIDFYIELKMAAERSFLIEETKRLRIKHGYADWDD